MTSGPPALLAMLERALSADALGPAIEPGAAARGIAQALAAPAAEILRRPGKRLRGRIVEAGWSLAAAGPGPPPELPWLVEILHAGSLVVDDIEDGSSHRRGEPALHVKVGLPLALNTGGFLYFLPFELLGTLELEAPVELAVRRRMERTLYRGHVGQALDLGTRASGVAQHEMVGLAASIARLKTGELMELAASLGPIVARAPAGRVEALAAFGMQLGVALQMHDDLGNLLGPGDPRKRHEDLRLGRVTHAWALLAARLARPAFTALQEEAQRVEAGDADPEALAARMRRELGADPCASARADLSRAFDELAEAVGPHPALGEIAGEIRRLEGGRG